MVIFMKKEIAFVLFYSFRILCMLSAYSILCSLERKKGRMMTYFSDDFLILQRCSKYSHEIAVECDRYSNIYGLSNSNSSNNNGDNFLTANTKAWLLFNKTKYIIFISFWFSASSFFSYHIHLLLGWVSRFLLFCIFSYSIIYQPNVLWFESHVEYQKGWKIDEETKKKSKNLYHNMR